jgi:hypothetical protein
MSEKSKQKKARQQIEILQLNRETLADLTEQEAEAAKGGNGAIRPTATCNCNNNTL